MFKSFHILERTIFSVQRSEAKNKVEIDIYREEGLNERVVCLFLCTLKDSLVHKAKFIVYTKLADFQERI